MACVGAVQVQCPECDVAVPIATEVRLTRREDDQLIVSVEPDLADVIVHAWAHEDQ